MRTMSTETVPIPFSDEKTLSPIVVDLGKQKGRRIKALKRGEGELLLEVAAVLAEVRKTLGDAARDQVLVPVVIVYKKKRKRTGLGLGLPFLG
jgi:hypothetical protein